MGACESSLSALNLLGELCVLGFHTRTHTQTHTYSDLCLLMSFSLIALNSVLTTQY